MSTLDLQARKPMPGLKMFVDPVRPGIVRWNDDEMTGFIVGPKALEVVRAMNNHDDLVRLLGWCVDTLRVRCPEVLGAHPEGSEAAKLLDFLKQQ